MSQLHEALRRWIRPSAGDSLAPDMAPEPGPAVDPGAEDENALDPHALAELRNIEKITGAPVLQRAIESYLRTAPTTLAAIRHGLAAGDYEAVRMAAHSLRSPSAQLGAARLSKACAELENLARSGTLAGADALGAALAREFEHARQLLERETS
jgi:HPt (histidine-containing phosphotransfer) domain-containing protein